ncbi:hypothetical protein POM88_030787 [Heracleum sosnowskyi]|uniref:Replication protein A 70 kDa DNA-binding subunit B/D first OB fold domain-containing protein n=1 Tax=Heracleum sosnowskyi TaxID=360622 RepID=A0AAD8HXG7_9APIA|nr:hypothetical protein POM88_030787 [Heracleum sosnowskyi]
MNKRSQLEAFFLLNLTDPTARKYTFDEIPQHYVWNETDMIWHVRKRGRQIGRFYSFLSLTTEKSDASICVRAQAVWKGINRKTKEFRGYNIVFIDNENCRIHAFISDKISYLFEEGLKEGEVYVLSKFQLKSYDGEETNRAVRNEKHIYFEAQTKLNLLKENVCDIDQYAFDLFRLQDVDMFLTDTRFLIDVIGIVDTPNAKCVYSKEDPAKSLMKFKIADGRFKVNVTFFNEFGESFEKALKDIGEETIVVIIASAKPNKYDGETVLTNFSATRFYLNPKHYSVNNFLRSMTLMDCEENRDMKIYTIEDIKNLSNEYIEKDVLCHVTVKKVEEECNWYANFCTSCGAEITKVDGRFFCHNKECMRVIPYPEKRFRLCTICFDKTGIVPIIFPDDEIQRLTGKDAFEIINDDTQVGEGIDFPPLLKQFEMKEYILTLTPSAKNINKSSKVFTAKS